VDKKLIGRETCQKVRLIKITMTVAISTTLINLIAAGSGIVKFFFYSCVKKIGLKNSFAELAEN
jgi:hypothetical protein